MGFFDRFFPSKKEAAALAMEEIRLGQISSRVLAQTNSKLGSFYPDADLSIAEIMAALKDIRIILGEFSKKQMKTENAQFEKIARQMKENYFERLPKIIAEIKKPDVKDFESYEKFHLDISQNLFLISKITSDNRYLIYFFKEEFEKLGRPVKSLAYATEELGEKISKAKPAYEQSQRISNQAREIMDGIEKNRAEGENIRIDSGKLDEEKNSLDVALKTRLEKELEELVPKSSFFENEISKTNGELASALQPLERLLRKYEKIAKEKKDSELISRYLGGNSNLLKKEPGFLMEFLRICKEVKISLSENSLVEDPKDRAKHLELLEAILGGKVTKLLGSLESLQLDLAKNRELINELEGKIAQISNAESVFAKKMEGLEKRKSELEENGVLVKSQIAELELEAGQYLDRKIKLVLENGMEK